MYTRPGKVSFRTRVFRASRVSDMLDGAGRFNGVFTRGVTMLRIHLDAADLGRIRFLDAPAPILEGAMMLFELRAGRREAVEPYRSDWRSRVRCSFPSSARPLGDLFHSRRAVYFLDVLAPEPDEGLEQVRTMPTACFDRDLRFLWPRFPDQAPSWLRLLAQGQTDARRTLDQALRAFHSSCIAPLWSHASACFEADVSQRMATVRRDGAAALLNALSDDMRFDGLTLELPAPRDHDVRADGKGLILAPSAFWTGPPLLTWDQREPSQLVLVYAAGPARRGAPVAGKHERAGDALAALLGPTRAGVLRALRHPRTTSALAGQLGISVPSASQHAATLRDAGLVSSHRHGQHVQHRITGLGLSLIHDADR